MIIVATKNGIASFAEPHEARQLLAELTLLCAPLYPDDPIVGTAAMIRDNNMPGIDLDLILAESGGYFRSVGGEAWNVSGA